MLFLCFFDAILKPFYCSQEFVMQTPRSLEAYRAEQHWAIHEFAAYLGVTPRTYQQLLSAPDQVKPATKRKVMLKLGVSPYLVHELVPRLAPADLASIEADIQAADAQDSWVIYDDNGVPTGERLSDLRR
jgi:transcriptional regulator with XRE-family HTH domain